MPIDIQRSLDKADEMPTKCICDRSKINKVTYKQSECLHHISDGSHWRHILVQS